MSLENVSVSAEIGPGVSLGLGSRVWGLAQIRDNASVGDESIIGRGAYVGPGVHIGRRCKVQNGAYIYEPARLGDGVFIGPGAILTNDLYPRATTPDGLLKVAADWVPEGVIIGEGASIGAGAICVAPVRIGCWAMVAAGAVVTSDVADYSLVRGVPARHVGWVGKYGKILIERNGRFLCPETGQVFVLASGVLEATGD